MTEIDPFERLRHLELQTYNKRYFYYNPIDGSIISIHNAVMDEPYPFIEMLLEELPENFASLNLIDFIVIDEDNKKTLTTKKIILSKIDGSIPTIYISSNEEIENEANLLIEQDNLKKEFRVRLTNKSKEQYWRDNTSLNFTFFVTLESDPTILHTTFIVSFSDLLEKDYTNIPFKKYNGSRSNVYTVKFFRSYLHVVYDENKNS